MRERSPGEREGRRKGRENITAENLDGVFPDRSDGNGKNRT